MPHALCCLHDAGAAGGAQGALLLRGHGAIQHSAHLAPALDRHHRP